MNDTLSKTEPNLAEQLQRLGDKVERLTAERDCLLAAIRGVPRPSEGAQEQLYRRVELGDGHVSYQPIPMGGDV